jgi:elongation factor 1-gamma
MPQILAVANINGLEIFVPPGFEFGKTNKTPEYIAKFPLGKIPSLETSTGFLLTEASAIAHYISSSGPKREQLLGSTVEDQALVQQWISFTDSHVRTTLTPLVMPFVNAMFRAPYNPKAEEENLPQLHRWFKYIEAHLKGRKWLVNDAEGPSLADITLAGGIDLGMRYYIDAEMRKEYPELTAWWHRLLAVPEVNEAFKNPALLEKRTLPESS